MADKENTDDYGSAKKEGPLKGIPTHALKKDIKAGKVLTGDDTKTSAQTPDPNVTSTGSDTDGGTSGTVTGDANTTRSTTTTRTTQSGGTATTSGT